MSGIPLFSGPSATNYASARYAPANTQTQANDNDCDTGSPQTQGDGSASSPTNLQISGPTEEQELEPPLVPNTFHIFVRTQVICPAGKVCPNVEDFRYHVVFSDAVSFSNPKEWRGSTIQQVFLITQTDRPDWQG